MSRLRPLLAVTLVTVVALSASGCMGDDDDDGPSSSSNASSESGEPKSGGSITVAVDGDASTLDPIIDDTYAATLINMQIFDTLVTIDDQGEYAPGLAESWENPDPRTWELKIVEGVTFHDGTPLDAEAVKWNLDFNRDPEGGSSWSSEFESIQNVTAVDATTVRVELKRPNPGFLSPLTEKPGMIRSPTAVEELGKRFASNPVGSGPFKFVEWVKNDHVTLEKNPDYWQEGKPYLDEATFRPITDPTAKVNDLLSGRLDTVDYVPSEQIERVEGASGLELEIGPPTFAAVVYLAMRTDEPPLDDPKVRQAVNLAIDREAIVENVVFGAGEPARSTLSSTSWGLTDDVPEIPYDPDQARELLGGERYSIEMLEPPSYPQVSQVIEQNLAEVGIDVKLRRMDWGQLIETYYNGDYQILMSDLLGSQRPDPGATLSAWYMPNGAFNATAYSSDEITGLLEEAGTIEDQAERETLYTEVQTLAQDAAPYAPIYHPKTVRAWADDIQGLEIPPDGLIHLVGVSRE
jgi:peptide/nickel transport system substrate-binding protein